MVLADGVMHTNLIYWFYSTQMLLEPWVVAFINWFITNGFGWWCDVHQLRVFVWPTGSMVQKCSYNHGRSISFIDSLHYCLTYWFYGAKMQLKPWAVNLINWFITARSSNGFGPAIFSGIQVVGLWYLDPSCNTVPNGSSVARMNKSLRTYILKKLLLLVQIF